MLQRDYRDIVAGAVLFVFGAFVALYCATHYSLGTLTRMGPGLLPTTFGVILVGLGGGIAVGGFFRAGQRVTVEVRAALAVLASLAAFAIVVETFGLFPAVVLLTLIAGLGDSKLRIGQSVLLAGALGVICTLIFNVGLNLPVQVIRWPW